MKTARFRMAGNALFLYFQIKLFRKGDLSAGNGGNDGQRFHPDALFPQQLSAFLEAFFNDDAAAGQLGAGLVDNLHQALEGFALCQEIIQYQHAVLRTDEFLGNLDVIVNSLGEGLYMSGVQCTIQIPGFGFLGEDHRYIAEMLGSDGGDANAGRFDGQNFGNRLSVETAAEFSADFVEKIDVHLVVEKAVNLQNIVFRCVSILQNSLFQKFHSIFPRSHSVFAAPKEAGIVIIHPL